MNWLAYALIFVVVALGGLIGFGLCGIAGRMSREEEHHEFEREMDGAFGEPPHA